jgi:hypothetical protein
MKENDDRVFLRDRLHTGEYQYHGRKHIDHGGLVPQFPLNESSAKEWLEWERQQRKCETIEIMYRKFFSDQRDPVKIIWNQRLNVNIHKETKDNIFPTGTNIYWQIYKAMYKGYYTTKLEEFDDYNVEEEKTKR